MQLDYFCFKNGSPMQIRRAAGATTLFVWTAKRPNGWMNVSVAPVSEITRFLHDFYIPRIARET